MLTYSFSPFTKAAKMLQIRLAEIFVVCRWAISVFGLGLLLCGVGCDDGNSHADTPDNNLGSAVQEAASRSASQPVTPVNRRDLYLKAFGFMDFERIFGLVKVDERGVSIYRKVEEAGPEMENLLNILEQLTNAAFHPSPIDWQVDFSNYPDLGADHWRPLQYGSLIIQWWVHKLIETGEIDMAGQIASIGLKIAQDVSTDGTLQGSVLALTIRDEICQVIAENVYRLKPADSAVFYKSLRPYLVEGNSWIADCFSYAELEKDWFIEKSQEFRANKSEAIQAIPDIDKEFFAAYYPLNGYQDPVDKVILKGVPASSLTDDRERAIKLIAEIVEEVGTKNFRQFLDMPQERVDPLYSRIHRTHKDLGTVLRLSEWSSYSEASQSLMKSIEDTPFVWNHATAWLKARKSEFMSRVKFSLTLGGLAWLAGNQNAAHAVVNPINGSHFTYQVFKDEGQDKGYFVFARDLDRWTYDSFSPFHQMLFITNKVDLYHPYGLQIGHKIKPEL